MASYFKLEESESHSKLKQLICSAPKPQLHLHLDGSLSFKFISAALKRLKQRKPEMVPFEKDWEPQSEEELATWMMKIAKGDQTKGMVVNDSENWRVFAICNYFLQTEIDLKEATYDLVSRLALQNNVNYLEIRFAPVLHTGEGLSEEQAVRAVLAGFENAKNDLRVNNSYEVDGGIILCALRSFPVSEAAKTVKLISSFENDNVLAFDIAGDEGSYPLKLFEDVIKEAIAFKINVTIHAGEWNEEKHDHVIEGLRLAVDWGVKRIGHGLALRSLKKDDELFQKMAEKNVAVEVCITSNCDDESKCRSYAEHPLPVFLKNNISIAALNVDNCLLAGNNSTGLPDPCGEFVRAILDCGISKEHLLALVESSYRAAFKPLQDELIGSYVKTWKEKVLPYL